MSLRRYLGYKIQNLLSGKTPDYGKLQIFGVYILHRDRFCRRGRTTNVHLFGSVGLLYVSLGLLVLCLKSPEISLDVPGLLVVVACGGVTGLGPMIKVGNKVWLLRKNITTTRPCSELGYRKLGPYLFLAKINPVAYHLELLTHFHINNIFHVSLLEPYHDSVITGHHPEMPAPIEIGNDIEYEVEEKLDSRKT